MKNTKEYKIIFTLSIILTLILFWQFFLKGIYPFPGNFMLGWYEPWKTNYTIGKTITIQHKPVADDTFRYLYPFKKLGIDVVKKGEVPLWNPYNGAGAPLLATYQWGFFNPFNIFFFILQAETAWSFYIITQVFILIFFMYLYCRKIQISMSGAIFATTIFTLSGFVIARLIFGNFIYPLAILPLILYLIEDYIGNHKTKKILLLPLATAFMLLSGHPHTTIYVIILSLSYLLYRLLSVNSTKEKISKALFFILLFLVGAGIASIQILPTIELLKHSNMTTQSSEFIFNRFLLPFSHLISILIPNYFGNQATYNYWGAGDYIETVAAIGLIPVFFAYFALLGKNSSKNHKIFFFTTYIVSILMTLDWFLPKLLYALPIPIISTSPPSRIFAITSFSIAILAGYGFDRWSSYTTNYKRLIIQLIPFAISIVAIIVGTFIFYKLGILCNNEVIHNCRLIALRNAFLETSAFVVTLCLFLFYIKTKDKKIKFFIPFVIISIVFILGAYNSYKFLPFSQKENILPTNPLIDAIKKTTSIERVFGFGQANIKTNFAAHFRFYDPNYYDPLYNKRYGELVAFANDGTISNLSRSDIEITTDLNLSKEKQMRKDRLINLLGVGYFIFKKSEHPLTKNDNAVWENEKWYLLKNNNSLPRVYLVNSFEVLTNSEHILKKLFDASFDPSATIVLEETISIPLNSNASENGKAIITQYKENTVELTTESKDNQLLILSDNYYPGWKAYVDGEETKIYRANYTFRTVEVPKGKHVINFTYKPFSFKMGASLSLLSLSSLLLYLVLNKKDVTQQHYA